MTLCIFARLLRQISSAFSVEYQIALSSFVSSFAATTEARVHSLKAGLSPLQANKFYSVNSPRGLLLRASFASWAVPGCFLAGRAEPRVFDHLHCSDPSFGRRPGICPAKRLRTNRPPIWPDKAMLVIVLRSPVDLARFFHGRRGPRRIAADWPESTLYFFRGPAYEPTLFFPGPRPGVSTPSVCPSLSPSFPRWA